jgi:hypothetical protein
MADQVFISYARKDGEEFAYKLHDSLEAKGISAWMDKRGGIREGKYWDKEIEKAVKACKVLLFVVTPGGVASDNCHDEWAYAMSLKKPVYPLMLIRADIPMRLNRVQYTDFSKSDTFDVSLDKLINRLRDHVVVDVVPRIRSNSHGQPTVFICYSRKDAELTNQLADFLRDKGYLVWTDVSGTTGGVEWHTQIEAALTQCDVMVMMWSEAAKVSQWVRKEMLFGMNIGKTIIPVRLDDTQLPLALIDVQPVDYAADESQSFAQLLRSLPITASLLNSDKVEELIPVIQQADRGNGMSLRDFRRLMEQNQ